MVSTAAQLRSYGALARLLVRHRDLMSGSGRQDGGAPASEGEAVLVEAGQRLATDLEELGPTFIKLGQLLSTRADLLPRPYLEALARLHDKVEPFSADEARAVFEAEIGARVGTAFSEFDDRPLAAASIGQVHGALMRDGRPVVVKIQRPGIEERVLADIEGLSALAGAVDSHTESGRHYGFGELFDQFHRSLLDELDYRTEAANLIRMGEVVTDLGVLVPSPIPDFTSRRVLTMQRVSGTSVGDIGPLGRLELDGPRLADTLIRAYTAQIFVHGFFHADPHPGNVFVTDEGTVAVVDLGMVGRLRPPVRAQLSKLVLSVVEERPEEVVDVLLSLGQPLEDLDEPALRREVSELVMRGGPAGGAGQAGPLLMALTKASADAGVRPAAELGMLARTLLNLEGVATLLDPDFDAREAVGRYASDVVTSQMRSTPGSLFSSLLEAKDFAEQLPRRVNRVMDALSQGEFSVKVQAFDEAEMLAGLQKLANRLAMGLVISALLLGAALLTRAPSSSRILGYPSVAIICFLIAAVLGVGMVLSIATADRHIRRRTRRRSRRPR